MGQAQPMEKKPNPKIEYEIKNEYNQAPLSERKKPGEIEGQDCLAYA